MIGWLAFDASTQRREYVASEPIAETGIGHSLDQFRNKSPASQHQATALAIQRQRCLGAVQLDFGSQPFSQEGRVRKDQRSDGSVFQHERDIGKIEGSAATKLSSFSGRV